MKKFLVLVSALASVLLISACDSSRDVVELYLQAAIDGSDPVIRYVAEDEAKNNTTFNIIESVKSDNEFIYTVDMMTADGSTAKTADLPERINSKIAPLSGKGVKIVVFQNKLTGEWLVDEVRSREETAKAQAGKNDAN